MVLENLDKRKTKFGNASMVMEFLTEGEEDTASESASLSDDKLIPAVKTQFKITPYRLIDY